MTKEEDELKYQARVKPRNPRRDGAHVGLAVSREFVKAYGGTLEVENRHHKGRRMICATLCWPIATEKNS